MQSSAETPQKNEDDTSLTFLPLFCIFSKFKFAKIAVAADVHNDSAADLKSHVPLVVQFCGHFV